MSGLAAAAARVAEGFHPKAAIAGCGGAGCGGSGGACTCQAPGTGTFPPGAAMRAYQCVPRVGEAGSGAYGLKSQPLGSEGQAYVPAVAPYEDEKADARNMTLVVGEATIAAGVSTTINVQPTMGKFAMYYAFVLAVDTANPQSQQRVGVGQFSVGDCPGDCRTIDVFSDVFEPNDNCCNGRPLRADFGRTNNGEQLSVAITNLNAAGSVTAQVIARGFCHRGTCAC